MYKSWLKQKGTGVKLGKLTATKVTIGKPRSGQAFTVSMVVTSAAVGVKGSVACSAKLAGKTLKVSKKGSVAGGKASCTWKVPNQSKGKQLKGSMTVTYKGKKVTRSFSKRVVS